MAACSLVACVGIGGSSALEVLSVVLWSLVRAWGAVGFEGGGGGVDCGWDHISAREEVPVAPYPEWWGQDGNLLPHVKG